MAKEVVNINKFYWGISQDDLYTREWEVAYAEGLELKSNSEFVRLWKNVEHLFTTNWNDMLCSTSLWTGASSHTYFLWEGWEVYYEGSSNNVALFTTAATKDVMAIESFNDTLYFAEDTLWDAFTLNSITEANALALNWTGNVSAFAQSWLDWSEAVMLNYQDINLYVGAWKRLYIYSKTDILTNTLTQYVDFKSEIRGITYVWSQVKIYTEDWNVTFLNALTFTTNEVVNIKVRPKRVKTIENFDYIISGYSSYDSQLLIMSWYDINVIAKRNDNGMRTKFNFSTRFGQTIAFDWRQLYFAQQEVGEANDEWILSYWRDRVSLTDAYNLDIFKADLSAWVQETLWIVSAIQAYESTLFFCYDWATNDKSVGKVVLNKIDSDKRTQLWTLLTKKFNAWTSTLNKDLIEIEVYGKFNGSCKIGLTLNDVYTSSATTTWITLDNDNDINEPIRITDLNTRFNSISLKFEFSWTFESTSSDKLYWAKISYNITRQ